MGRPPEPHTAATSAPQPRQETTAAPLVVDDSASPLLSQPPEVLPALAASGAVLLEPARLEEKAFHAGGASGSGASMLAGHKPPQKVWKRTVCLYTYTAASGTYIYVYQCSTCCHYVSMSIHVYVCMYVCMYAIAVGCFRRGGQSQAKTSRSKLTFPSCVLVLVERHHSTQIH